MAERTCFSRDELREYLLGELPDALLDKVAVHLESCAACEATVTELDLDSDTLIEALRTPAQPADLGSAYRLAARRIATRAAHSAIGEGQQPSTEHQRLRDYELLEPLARGGMGAVFRARHVRLNRDVALKVLPARWLAHPAAVQRFQREMQAVGALQHPAIVQATDGGEVDGVHFLVMELIAGVDGSALVRSWGPLPIAAACEIARQAALGMAYVHEQGIIHRDLKPSNLMVTKGGEVKVLDLGLARIAGEKLAADELTTVGQLMGTLDYMAPEQLQNSHAVDERADIYSLGATLYKLLAGCTPHGEPRDTALWTKLRRVALEPITPLLQQRPDVPPELAAFVESLLSRETAQRPPTMQAVATALTTWSQSHGLKALVAEAALRAARQKPTPDELPRHPTSDIAELLRPLRPQTPGLDQQVVPRRRPGLWIAAVLLLIVAGLCGIVFTLQWNSGQLVIETATPDVEVRVKRAGQPYRQMTLKQLASSFRLGAGDYEIEIVGPADGLEIENGRYTLKRGETWLARITHSAIAAAAIASTEAAPAVGEPRYEDRTLSQWLTLLREERSPEKVYLACKALQTLGDEKNSQQIAAALLEAMRHQDRTASYAVTAGRQPLAPYVTKSLGRLNKASVVAALASEFDQHFPRSIEFGLNFLQASDVEGLVGPELLSRLERLASDAEPPARILSLELLTEFSSQETARKKLYAALSDDDPVVQLQAARLLIDQKAADDRVVQTLRQRLNGEDLSVRAQAAHLLGKLGPLSKEALPELLAIVHSSEDSVDEEVFPIEEQIDLASGAAGVHLTNLRSCAAFAVGEIGDQSAAPGLVEAFERSQHTARSRSSDELLAIAIEKLTDLRPDAERATSSSPHYVYWTWRHRSLAAVCSSLFEQADHRYSWDEALETIRQVLPRASEYERKQACDRYLSYPRNNYQNPDLTPDRDLRAKRIEVFKLFAKYHDLKSVVAALLKHADVRYSGTLLTEWEGTSDQLVALAAYRDAAVSIVRSQPESRAEILDVLTHEVDQSFVNYIFTGGQTPTYSELGVLPTLILAELLAEADADKQLAMLERVLIVQGPQKNALALLALEKVQEWLTKSSSQAVVRAELQKKLRDIEADQRRCEALCIGMIRVGLADAELLRREVLEPADRTRINYAFFRSVLWALRHQPGMGELRVELLQKPYLNFGEVNRNYRAQLLPMLIDIPPADREIVRPFLESLQAGPNATEAAAARQVLEAWQQ